MIYFFDGEKELLAPLVEIANRQRLATSPITTGEFTGRLKIYEPTTCLLATPERAINCLKTEFCSQMSGLHIVAVFSNQDREVMTEFFKSGGAAAIRTPGSEPELTQKICQLFGRPPV